MDTISGVAKVHDVPANWKRRAWLDDSKYQTMYRRSVDDPDGFWGDIGHRLNWIKPYTKVKNTSFDPRNALLICTK
jgi:acetyl-CoA synthetase